MSFFGQNTNNSNNQQQHQQQPSGFGGFGSTGNTGSGFGQPQNTGFGTTPNNFGGGLFGSNANTGFGSGGFGTTSSSTPFGSNRPAFGSNPTSSSTMFGATTATAGGSSALGGFGGGAPTSNSGGLFGGNNKPAFGGGGSTGGSIFGGGSSGSVFGSTSNQPTSAFGAPISSALSSSAPESQGTGSTPFQAHAEKESGSTVTNHFQSISFMQPYKNFSFEELRQADYNQGRQFGNGSGQAGAFGSTNFSGFGQQNNSGPFGGSAGGTSGGLFNAQPASTASPFGTAQTTGSSFGGGLFGTAKPASTSLFGTTNTSAAQPAGGLFGTAPQTGFGSTSGSFGGAAGAGGFGGNAQPNQISKAGFSFGGAGTSNTFGTALGSTNTTGGSGLFGGGQTASGFGVTQQPQQQQAPSNPFGNFGTNQASGQTGANSTFGTFGTQTTQKPGGGFGTTSSSAGNTGGSLFAGFQSNNTQQPQGGLFGPSSTNQTGSGSGFGAKPAGTGGSIFSLNTTNTSSTGGGGFLGASGFGANYLAQNQQNQGTSLFGNSNTQQPKLFGVGGSSTTGSGLFSNNSNSQQPATGNSVFGGMSSNTQTSIFPNTSNNGWSVFSNQTQQPNALQPPQPQTTNVLDPSPYGSASIFTGLPPPPQMHAGPIATPISTAPKTRKSTVLPQYKINPIQASRLVTPQKHGFGFSYSTYGTPSSIASIASNPGGLSSSLLNGSIGRGLGKSLSTSNLRRSFDPDGESILSSGAFSAGNSRLAGSGSLKKLTIDRNLRSDLFTSQGAARAPNLEKMDQTRQPGILKKKVSFDASAIGGERNDQTYNGGNTLDDFAPEDTHNSATPSAPEQGFLRSSSRNGLRSTGPKSNGILSHSEMESVKGNELAIVLEDDTAEPILEDHRSVPKVSQADPQPGPYWMKPKQEYLSKLSKAELKRVKGFRIGRDHCGYVEFDEPVDLTLTSLDEIYEKIALIGVRSLTVYPDSSIKPPVGQGMNVPSTIFLENSWPREKDRKTPLNETSGPRFDRHVDRLEKVTDTEFVRYETGTGIWVFKVPHFTTYSLEYDDSSSEDDDLETSQSHRSLDNRPPHNRSSHIDYPLVESNSTVTSALSLSEGSPASSSPDDTFDFRKKNILPGAFNQSNILENGDDAEDIEHMDQSFLVEDTTGSASEEDAEEPSDVRNDPIKNNERSVVIQDDELEMAGSFPHSDLKESEFNIDGDAAGHASRFTVNEQGHFQHATPAKLKFDSTGGWAAQLQRTISPRKQDRQALRQRQDLKFDVNEQEYDYSPSIMDKIGDSEKPLTTSIDLMNSLFGKQEAQRSTRVNKKVVGGKGFKWPYSKNPQRDEVMGEADQHFHQSYKPHWGPETTLLYAMPTKFDVSRVNRSPKKSLLFHSREKFVSEARDLRFAKFMSPSLLASSTQLAKQRASTKIEIINGVPFAEPRLTTFQEIAAGISGNSKDETFVWELAAILFDELFPPSALNEFPNDQHAQVNHIRKHRLIHLWMRLCDASAMKDVSSAASAEERALAQLSANNVVEACGELIQGKNFRLAILLSQIDGGRIMHDDMKFQLQKWRELSLLSEITDPVRALYELLSGNSCLCEGMKGPLEHRAKSFVISERFGLDWRRAFGLRLWYEISDDDPLEVAVKKYSLDLENEEKKQPAPIFQDVLTTDLWDDKNRGEREDILWGLLKLYAAIQDESPLPPIADIVMPHNTSGNPLDCRLSFRLYQALSLRFPPSDPSKGDQLVRDFAAQLDSAGAWMDAMFVLLHLSNHHERQQALQLLLAYHVKNIPDDTSNSSFTTLTSEFLIPAAWIWEAKALYARCVAQDSAREVQFLLLAGNWAEAHHTMCTTVAPRAIIEEDLANLGQLLNAFHNGKRFVADWTLGGQVYEDFEKLANGASGRERVALLKRLLVSLPKMSQQQAVRSSLEEIIAVKDMSWVVAQAVLEEDENKSGFDIPRVLQLPLADDVYMAHTLQIAMRYYKNVMVES